MKEMNQEGVEYKDEDLNSSQVDRGPARRCTPAAWLSELYSYDLKNISMNLKKFVR